MVDMLPYMDVDTRIDECFTPFYVCGCVHVHVNSLSFCETKSYTVAKWKKRNVM